ncbi:MAG: Ferric transporter ATP-binding subunit [Dehalococcoidia bacterium]|nr:Ferric transporter ATP-binding subunit [Dehalococcoidia bacterium]
MNRIVRVFLTTVLVTILLTIPACSPASPGPVSTPVKSAPQLPVPAASSPGQVSPQDAEWNKVIEAAKAEGSVVIYAGSDFGGPLRPAIINSFQEKYGISVSMLVGRGQDALQRVKVEKQIKRQVADMVQQGGTSTSDFLEADLADPMEKLLPELQINKDKFNYSPVYDPQGRAVGATDLTLGPLINTNLVKPGDEPKSWFDIINPKWKGKILLADPRRGGAGMSAFQTLQFYKIVDESYFQKLLELDPGLWGGSSQEADNMVARGEYALGFNIAFELAMPLVTEGAPVKFLDMKEGQSVQTGNIMLVKDRPHPNAARLLANWLLSAEGQKIIHSSRGSKSIRKDVGDFTPEKGRIKITKPLLRDYNVTVTTNTYQEMANRLFGKK